MAGDTLPNLAARYHENVIRMLTRFD